MPTLTARLLLLAATTAVALPSLALPANPGASSPAIPSISPGDYADEVAALMAESLSAGRAMERLTELCNLAPHRLAGSPGYLAAAEWARQTMLADGLENVHLEWVEVPRWVRGKVGLVRLVEPAAHAAELPMLALGGSVATPKGGLTAEVVVVDSLAAAADLGERARGRIVLFNGPMDRSLPSTFPAYSGAVGQRVRGAVAAAHAGAVAALVRSMTTRTDDVPHTGGMRYADDVPAIPTAAISTLAADKLAALVAAGHKLVLHFEQDCESLSPVRNPSVVGEYRGTSRADEILLVGGHLDAWGPGHGAMDDGGGCCQALEAVRLMSALGLRPRRTIRVVFFANEENGLAGGRGYAEQHLDELPRHVLAVESDSGSFTPRGFSTDAKGEAWDLLHAIVGLLEPWGAGHLVQGGGGADIGPMAPHGVLQMELMPDSARYFDLHHSARDIVENINPRELQLCAGSLAALLYVAADIEPGLPANGAGH